MSDSAFEVESFLRVISWTVLVIYYLDILLECVSAEVVFIHQIHLSDTTVMKIYLYIFFELWSHFIQSSFFSSGSFLTGSDSVPDPFLQNQALLFHTIKFHIQKKFHRVSVFISIANLFHEKQIVETKRIMISSYSMETIYTAMNVQMQQEK